VVHVTNGPHVAMRLGALEFLLGHFLSVPFNPFGRWRPPWAKDPGGARALSWKRLRRK
jgi:hypothetical protein